MSEEKKTIQEMSHDLFAVRKAKLEAMRENGFDPFRRGRKNLWLRFYKGDREGGGRAAEAGDR